MVGLSILIQMHIITLASTKNGCNSADFIDIQLKFSVVLTVSHPNASLL